MTVGDLKCGVVAGTVAGIAYGIFMAVVMNPLITYLEEIAHQAPEQGHESTHVVSETTTAIVSGGSGVLWGILLGGIFGLVFYFLEPILPGTGRLKAYVLAGAGFFTVSVVPWLAFPPATPGTTHAGPVTGRLLLYGGLMIVGALAAGSAFVLYQRTRPRNRVSALVFAAIPILGVVTLIPLATPARIASSELPPELVTAFQGIVLLSQLALWIVIAAGFNWYRDRTESAVYRDDVTANP